MGTGRQYDERFKMQAVKLAREVGTKKAAEELDIPKNTLGGWVKKAKDGEINIENRDPGEALNLAQQLQEERKRVKTLEKRIKELEELNEFLEEASAFFAASRQKYAKKKE